MKMHFGNKKADNAIGHNTGYAPNLDRDKKAIKIQTVLEDSLGESIVEKNILDVGSGTGGISLYFAERGYHITSVDVQEPSAQGKEKLSFIKLNDVRLPLEDCTFDVVFYNMVMEHLLAEKDQMVQLQEINRVLKPNGVCYFSQPNRIFPIEPHTGVWFLHWLPNSAFFGFAKLFGCYRENVWLHTYFTIKRMIRKAGFTYKEYTAKIIANPGKYAIGESVCESEENGDLWKIIQCLSPINIFVIRKRDNDIS